MTRKLINPPATEFLYNAMKFSQAVHVGDTIWVSGQVGFNAQGIPDDVTEQARLAFGNMQSVLEHAGAKLSDVVEYTVYLTDINHSEAFNKARDEFVTENYPCFTVIGVSALANPKLKLEIKATAVINSSL